MEEKNSHNIYDIANAAGVSIATVSRVLTGNVKVSEQTQKKVLDVMEELNYIPNAFARGLGLGSMKLVGILCTDVSDVFYAKAISLLEHLLKRYGLNALLYSTGEDVKETRSGLDILRTKHVDAIILVGSPFVGVEDDAFIRAAANQTPVFCINGLVKGDNIYCVLCDDKQAMHENADHLFDYGCENILYIYDKLTYSGCQKLEGFRDAYTNRGRKPDESLIVCVEKNLPEVIELVNGLIRSGKQFDGVLASEDILAVGACKSIALHGKQLPVIGFNDSVFAECATPTLTSLNNMLESICATAVSMLNDILHGKEAPQIVTVSGRLVERETFKVPDR